MGAAALVTAATADALLWEPQHPVARHVEIYLKRLPEAFDGFRIAQISDLHFGPFLGKAGVERALQIAESFQPDLVALTGDFVSHPFGEDNGPTGAAYAGPCADVLARCKTGRLVAILGNHDHWNGADIVAALLKSRGIDVLRNASLPIERDNSRLWIAGIDDAYVQAADMTRTLGGIPSSEATILLAHEPDFADVAARYSVDLQLSGHSHGGQVRLPGIGALILPAMAEKYSKGLYRIGNLQLYTNVGIGVIDPPVRFLCPPEVTLFTLRLRRN